MAQSTQQKRKTPLWEKAIAGVGVIFLLTIIGFLVDEAVQSPTPPVITVATVQVQAVESGYLVEIEVTNRGESTAAVVEVEGTLQAGEDAQAQPPEASSTTFDFIPAQSTRGGGLFFRADPTQRRLELQAKGYVEP